MGGFFGAISKRDCVLDMFFGVDYHSHLGTRRGGMIIYDQENGFQRQIHNIENTPFRTKFENDLRQFHGNSGIGCISDTDTCRFWDVKTGEKLDKDRFRRDLGNVEGAYQEMARRLLGK